MTPLAKVVRTTAFRLSAIYIAVFSLFSVFFIVYIATFNEWHEGTSFEPMKDRAALLPQEVPFTYHNPARGRYRLDYLKRRLDQILRG